MASALGRSHDIRRGTHPCARALPQQGGKFIQGRWSTRAEAGGNWAHRTQLSLLMQVLATGCQGRDRAFAAKMMPRGSKEGFHPSGGIKTAAAKVVTVSTSRARDLVRRRLTVCRSGSGTFWPMPVNPLPLTVVRSYKYRRAPSTPDGTDPVPARARNVAVGHRIRTAACKGKRSGQKRANFLLRNSTVSWTPEPMAISRTSQGFGTREDAQQAALVGATKAHIQGRSP